jgi:hypothetical protein
MTAIIDAREHIWRRRARPWLVGLIKPRIVRPHGPVWREPVWRDDGYLGDLADCEMTASLYAQANRAKAFERKVAYAQHVAADHPLGIVGYADALPGDVRAQRRPVISRCGLCAPPVGLHWHKIHNTISPRGPIPPSIRGPAGTWPPGLRRLYLRAPERARGIGTGGRERGAARRDQGLSALLTGHVTRGEG